jgi:hypothetical protein
MRNMTFLSETMAPPQGSSPGTLRLAPAAAIVIVVLASVWFAGNSALMTGAMLKDRLLTTALDLVTWLGAWGAAAALAWRWAPRRLRPWHVLPLLGFAAALVVARIGALVVLVDLLGLAHRPWLLLWQFPWHLTFVTAAAACGAATRVIVREREEAAELARLEQDLEGERARRLRESLDPDALLTALRAAQIDLVDHPERADYRLLELSQILRQDLRRVRASSFLRDERRAGS